jgi:hypothetical protein
LFRKSASDVFSGCAGEEGKSSKSSKAREVVIGKTNEAGRDGRNPSKQVDRKRNVGIKGGEFLLERWEKICIPVKKK